MSRQGILLDIEGTVSPVSFVYEVLFPFARRNLEAFLRRTIGQPATLKALALMAKDAGYASIEDWSKTQPDGSLQQTAVSESYRLMDADVKATGLKELQGLIWAEGYAEGKLKSVLFEDVPTAIKGWVNAGRDVRIYSSGSAKAQQVFFAHTEHGDLTPYLSGYYDTTYGAKREAGSYRRIAEQFDLKSQEITFFSDVPAELDAAGEAGMATVLMLRPGNAPVEETCHRKLTTMAAFEQNAAAR